jgi:integrase
MGRPKKYNLPENVTYDQQRNRWVVRNPVNGKRKRFETEAAAVKSGEALNKWLAEQRLLDALDTGLPTIGGLVAKWETDKLQFMPWDAGTRSNMLHKMRRIARELGPRPIARTDCMFLEEWLAGFCSSADVFNKWRYALVLLWKFAVSRKLAATCEPEKIEPRSTSKKLEANKKTRQQLDLQGFRAIHERAPAWLQLAMDQSLVTLQSRLEVCNMRHADYRDGHLFVIRDKVSGDSDMAFIKIAITAQLDDLRRRSLRSGIASPFLVHRAPDRRRREWTEGKPHWTYVVPDYLSKAFADARDAVERFGNMPTGERPTFHEIRGLGARLYRSQGMPEDAIQALMTHAHQRTTQIYLDRGEQALTDADYHPVTAPMVISDLKR